MRWRAYLAWYDGQIGVQGVFRTEEEARRAAQKALEKWRAGKLFPEWNDAGRDCADPVIRLYGMEIPAVAVDAGAE